MFHNASALFVGSCGGECGVVYLWIGFSEDDCGNLVYLHYKSIIGLAGTL